MRIGLVSDTHGVLHPDVARVFAGVDRILHAGDVGDASVLAALGRIAPVSAVRGNADPPALARRLPAVRRLDVGGVRIVLLHHGLDRGRPTDALRRALAQGPRVAVFGHSHVARVERRDGVLLVNPGGAGRRRFALPRSVALLDVDRGRVAARIVVLDSPRTPA